MEVVPGDGESGLGSVAEHSDVLTAAHALVHQVEDAAVEALDARLNVDHSGFGQGAQLGTAHVRLDLDVHPQVVAAVDDAGQDGVEVAHVQDVVDDVHVQHTVTACQVHDLFVEDLRALAAELHEGAVESAESAVVLLPPPAAAGPLDDELGFHPVAGDGGRQPLEVAAVVGRQDGGGWQRAGAHGVRGAGAVRAPVAQAGDRGQVSALVEGGEQLGEGGFALAADHEVEEGEVAVAGRALLGIAVGAAHDGPDVRGEAFDVLGGGERGGVLLEGGGEADDVGAGRDDPLGGLLNELRYHAVQFVRHPQPRVAQLAAHRGIELRYPPLGVVVEGGGEHPVAASHEVRGERVELVVVRGELGTPGDPVGELQVGVQDIGVAGGALVDAPPEDAEGEGREVDRGPGHVDQQDAHVGSS